MTMTSTRMLKCVFKTCQSSMNVCVLTLRDITRPLESLERSKGVGVDEW